jgi:Ca-activated chloride channel family protein
MSFESPWFLWALILPFAWRRLGPWRGFVPKLWLPVLADMPLDSTHRTSALPRSWTDWIPHLIWACIVVALANPMQSSSVTIDAPSGRDIQVVMDTSQSMDRSDMVALKGESISRLAAVKQALLSFAERREGDRLGLITFGEQSFVLTQITDNRSLWAYMLSGLETGFTGDSTRLGDALGYATALFLEAPAARQVIILLTDGNDTGSDLPPRVAQESGGEFYRAQAQSDFDAIWRSFDTVEPIQERTQVVVTRTSWSAWPLGGALILSLVMPFAAVARPKAGRQS